MLGGNLGSLLYGDVSVMSWEDNIKEWTGREFGESVRAVEDNVWWRCVVGTTSGATKVKGLQTGLQQ